MVANKYLILTVNVFLILFAILLLGFGIRVQQSIFAYAFVLEKHVLRASICSLMLSMINLATATAAILGIWLKNKNLLCLYTAVSFICIGFEIGAASNYFVVHDEILGLVKHNLHQAMPLYRTNSTAAKAFDIVQTRVQCCGIYHYKEWYPYFNETSIPDSCCVKNTIGCGRVAVQTKNVYQQSCNEAVANWIHAHLLPCVVILGFLIGLKLLVSCFNFTYLDEVKSDN